jgi:hypothetical protein
VTAIIADRILKVIDVNQGESMEKKARSFVGRLVHGNAHSISIFTLLLVYNSTANPALAFKFVTYDADGTKHIHAPFVNVAVKKHADGTKDVDVKAPFTKVHNPAGVDNAEVKAPFTKVEPKEASSTTAVKTAPTVKKPAAPSPIKQNSAT